MNLEKHKKYLLTEHEAPRIRPKHINKDNMHYNTTKLDGAQKPFRFCISEREAGKSTTWTQFYDYNYMYNYTIIALRRQIADVTETYINDVENVINKFNIVPVKLMYKTADIKTGIVDVYIAEVEKKKNGKLKYYNKRLFFRVIGLSNPMSRIKSLLLPNVKYILFDEFICNTKAGEKYLKDEAFRFKELYNTFQRECKDGTLIFYGFANPYSVFAPLIEMLGVDTRKIRPGAYINGDNYTIECYQLKPELKEHILKHNPLYKFDDGYRKYAFGGVAVNDENIPLGERMNGAQLRFVFKTCGEYLGFYYNQNGIYDGIHFYCEKIKWNPNYAKTSYCFDFMDAQNNTNIFQSYNKCLTTHLKRCIAQNRVLYKDVGAAYLTEYIFSKL